MLLALAKSSNNEVYWLKNRVLVETEHFSLRVWCVTSGHTSLPKARHTATVLHGKRESKAVLQSPPAC